MSTEPMTTDVLAPVATPATAPATTATPAIAPRRRVFMLAGLRRIARAAFMVALLVGGVSLGYSAFVNSQPVTPTVGDPATDGVDAPPAVAELAVALATNDADNVRAAVQGDPYKLLTSEMERWNFRDVAMVETLSTLVDGDRTATVLVIVGHATDGTPVTVNLIVQTQDGAIVSFR